jgi:hypothetical protein
VGDAAVVIILLIVIGLVAMPGVRRWLRSDQTSRLVDPDQNITVDPIPGLPGLYETNYRPRRMPRGRRHQAPLGAVIHRREDDRREEEEEEGVQEP